MEEIVGDIVDESFDVDTAPCIHTTKLKNECWEKNSCPYFSNRNTSLSNNFAVLNPVDTFSKLSGPISNGNLELKDSGQNQYIGLQCRD